MSAESEDGAVRSRDQQLSTAAEAGCAGGGAFGLSSSRALSKHDKGLVYPTVACALSGVVVSEASRFVALCCRPCRTVIVDRDKLMVSYLLRIFS